MTFARLACIVGVVATTIGGAARAQTAAETPTLVPDGLSWRSRGGELALFPGGRLQVDGAFFPKQNPKSGVFIRRARVELRGWVGDAFYFDVGGDFAPAPPAGAQVAPSLWPAADNFLAYAPFGDALIVQAGQFDVPFTLENRTSDGETDVIERAMTSRTLGVPRNKDVGAMVHGLVADARFYYSAGLFDGEGPGFRNLDNQADAIGRLVWAPFADRDVPWRRLSIGGSAWHGNHVLGPEAPVQATPGGVVFFQPQWSLGAGSPGAALHEQGATEAFAGELNVALGPRLGLRGEFVWKKQHLGEGTEGATGFVPVGNATLDGIAGTGEIWLWLLGDQGLLPAPGFELPVRGARPDRAVLADGLMVALRGEFLKEDLNSDTPTLGDPAVATTRVLSGTAGVNYWRGRFIRLSANYVLHQWSGTSETAQTLVTAGRWEHEILVRLALAL
jgi:hypothetical protein